MKISLNWVREFTNVKLSIDELVSKIGAQLGEVEEVVALGDRYKGVTVVKVITCEKHPNADKLSVCMIDDGGVNKKVKRDDKGYVQVVCGAPNVRAGITVAWVPPGAIVPSTYNKEQFKLDVRPLRGIDSNGMLASGKELDINDDSDGILILDKPTDPGTPLADVYDLDDYIIEVENKMFTHRPDCFGMLGVAREIAGISQVKFESPEWYNQPLDKLKKGLVNLSLTVDNQIPSLVPRFMALAMSGVKVTRSPITMQSYLNRVGIKPINNVVDITNFVMMLTGQPLHAYDYDKVAFLDKSTEAALIIRKPQKGEKIALLNGKTIEPRKDAMMIATRQQLVGVGGVMGGSTTEVDATTTSIILECASFDMYSIRKTSMAHGLFTDAVTRFNKGQSPLQNDIVLAYAAGMLQKLASAEAASKVVDTAPEKVTNYWPSFKVSVDFINKRLGLSLGQAQIAKLLDNVEILVEPSGEEYIEISPPFWRTDLEIGEDIVEEVGRLYGYDHLPLVLPKRSLTPAPNTPMIELKTRVRDMLSSAGASELLTYSFVHSNLLEKAGQDTKHALKLSNALSPDLQYYRLSMTPSLLDKVHLNIKAGHNEFALFEMNKVHNNRDKDEDENNQVPAEHQRLALVYAATQSQAEGAAYYQAKVLLEYLASQLGIILELKPLSASYADNGNLSAWLSPFEPSRSCLVMVKLAAQEKQSATLLGVVGEYKQSVRKGLKLPTLSAGFELDSTILRLVSTPLKYVALSKFPKTQQDISFKLASGISYNQLTELTCRILADAENEHGYTTELSPVDIYQAPKTKTKNVTLRITLSHAERTLVTSEVNKLLDDLAVAASSKLKATRL